jgi:nicotinate-nucleotide--dimethylbenzimidazole phosphoribosyltransferase
VSTRRSGDPAIDRAVDAIGPLDGEAMDIARRRLDRLTKPHGSLGRLEELVIHLAGITGDAAAAVRAARVVVAAGDHGVARRGVSAWPQSVTGQMVSTSVAGRAAINVLAAWAGVDVTVVDAGLVSVPVRPAPGPAAATFVEAPVRRGGTADASVGPAMTRDEAIAAVELGLRVATDALAGGARAFGLGEMGIGNTTAASAVAAILTGRPAAEVTGRGAGIEGPGLARKIEVVEAMLAVNAPRADDPIGVLAAVAGFEMGVLVGVAIGAAAGRVPVVVDGFITTAAVALASRLAPRLPERLIAGHRSAEPGHGPLLEQLGLVPLLELDLRLGEGTGAVLALGLLEAACRIRDEMATFEEAGIAVAPTESPGGRPQAGPLPAVDAAATLRP